VRRLIEMREQQSGVGPHVFSFLLALGAASFVVLAPGLSGAADPIIRQYIPGERGVQRGFSDAVLTEGGTIVWLAGQTVVEDADGNSISGDFGAQTHEIFRRLGERLEGVGGSLADIVTMTTYIVDPRYADQFADIRQQYLDPERAPSSALITVVGFTRPGVLLEVKATAVVGDEA
jgi:2-iminobutanoate/2-iminopropanoate deaminase